MVDTSYDAGLGVPDQHREAELDDRSPLVVSLNLAAFGLGDDRVCFVIADMVLVLFELLLLVLHDPIVFRCIHDPISRELRHAIGTWTSVVRVAAAVELVDVVGEVDAVRVVVEDNVGSTVRIHRGAPDVGVSTEQAPKRETEGRLCNQVGRKEGDVKSALADQQGCSRCAGWT